MTAIKNRIRRLFLTVYYRLFRIWFGRYEMRNRAKPKTRLSAGQAIRVLFLIQYPEMWNSEKPLVDAMLAHPDFEPILLCVPKYDRKKKGDACFSGSNAAYDFLAASGYQPVNALNGTWVSIREIDPDFIFLQRPYPVELPGCYSFGRLMKIARLCYIPYSGRMTRGIHISIEFHKAFLRYFSVCFADGQDSFTFVSDWVKNHGLTGLKKVYNVGFPRYDLLKDLRPDPAADPERTRFLWLPRWSLADYNDKSHFLDYIEPMLQYFTEHPDYELIIRPHPLMFSNFIKHGAITEADVAALKDRIDRMPNVSFDPEGDYLKTFCKTDVLISDVTSLLLEFFYTRKPVILCGQLHDLTQEGEQIDRTFYKAADFGAIRDAIGQIRNGDPLKPLRDQTFEALGGHRQSASQTLCEILLNETNGG